MRETYEMGIVFKQLHIFGYTEKKEGILTHAKLGEKSYKFHTNAEKTYLVMLEKHFFIIIKTGDFAERINLILM